MIFFQYFLSKYTIKDKKEIIKNLGMGDTFSLFLNSNFEAKCFRFRIKISDKRYVGNNFGNLDMCIDKSF